MRELSALSHLAFSQSVVADRRQLMANGSCEEEE
jgi:hypothetical protein